MQEGAELEDEEKTMVEELQNACFVSGSSRGKQEDPPEVDERLRTIWLDGRQITGRGFLFFLFISKITL